MKPDITYAMNESEANFVAETPAGEKFLGKPEINIQSIELVNMWRRRLKLD